MKLGMLLEYATDFRTTARQVAELEKAGLDLVMVPEAYGFDSISQVGYLAAVTDRLQIGTGIVNIYSRSPALLGMTAAGCDYITGGRFFLGLGASGPQVVEGFHGVPYEKPVARTRDIIDVVRKVLRREVLTHDGTAVKVPLPGSPHGKPLKLINHPVRPTVPIWWASLKEHAVTATAEVADGWLPVFFMPERAREVWGKALEAGTAKRSPELASLEIMAGGKVAIGDNLDVAELRHPARDQLALYVGGMGARDKNFYNDIAVGYGFADAARTIQDLYLDGKKAEAAAAVPEEMLEGLTLIGPAGLVKERIAAYREAGVTVLNVEPVGDADPVRTIETLRELLDV